MNYFEALKKYKNIERNADYTNYKSWIKKRNEAYKQAKKIGAELAITFIKKGDIFVSNWGYDQTNIEFYQVVEKKDKTLIIREIAKKKNYDNASMTGTCLPIKNQFIGKPLLKKVSSNILESDMPRPAIRFSSYKTADVWDGEEKEYSCYA